MTTLLDLDTQRNYYISESASSGYSSASSPSLSVHSNDSSCHGIEALHINLEDFPMDYARQYIYTDIPMQSTAHLVIIEQPVEKFRFRYKSEMHGTHGSLMGIQTEKSKKSFPTVELRGYNGRAVIRCRLYQVEVPQPHSHRLVVRKGDEDINDPHDVTVSPEEGFRAVFQGMGIIHTAKKHIVEELILKKEREKRFELGGRPLTTREISQIKLNAEKEAKAMNLNQVCLGFQAFGVQNDGSWVKLCEPVFSKPINNMKSALTGELKISRMSASTSSAAGHEDLFLFVEKVGKKNIKVRFFELDKYDEEVWEGWGSFCEADVHHQYAIALYTPPYKNVDIEKSVDVFIQLVRPSDDDRSPPLPFKYKPKDCVISRKRARMSSSTYSSSELPVSVVMASDSQSESGAKTISEEYNRDQILDTFLKSLTSLNSADLLNLAEPLVDAEETDSAGPIKPSVIQRTPYSIKEEKTGLDRLYQIMRTSGASPDVDLVRKIFIEENLLHNAIGGNNSTAIRRLLTIIHKLEISDVLQSQNEQNETCLHYACSLDLAEYIRPLINLGADPNMGDNHGNTPLHIAVQENHSLCVSKIIDQSSYTAKSKPLQIDLANHEGLTPLHLAARNKNLALVRKLLETGKASTKIAIAKNGNNVLHIAVEENDKDMVKYLVENTSVNVNEPNTCGFTPLQLAYGVRGISKEIIEVLSKNSSQSDLSRNPAPPMDMDESSTDDEDEDKGLKIDEENEENDGVLPEECVDELSTILNKDNRWKNLARLLEMHSTIIKLCEQDSNPSRAMFRFINDDNVSFEDILKAMKDLNMKDAINCIASNLKNGNSLKH